MSGQVHGYIKTGGSLPQWLAIASGEDIRPVLFLVKLPKKYPTPPYSPRLGKLGIKLGQVFQSGIKTDRLVVNPGYEETLTWKVLHTY
ncbi:MAG: hypothetical protein P5694_23490 [Limnospira sp. PMC 1286.21]|uniref:Uncharacterized protein n=1 Tax=Limnospira fusiformis PMC 851.14 TaxID=2219512 RepID=A0ABU9EQA3_LIMFS|nr:MULTISPECIES: hypothetical protein [Limnospira]EKD10240.1 2-methylcitrate dehydratase [Arthrospira platensis C1]MDT9180564.1 hypothetical protein [Limnospira sp. PMC 1238.20]MDT9206137.1 hypothetical protein [Limnospira sp. PMC 1243.20]MDT9246872.1 hypothetical protein [Limnospira sp. PMC 1249.20]MDT9272375.1 hypothetical protein [Limnospira sp. PMC 1234.20]MDT9282734.1 hypothetical protein [Limnospira sp. PMC 1293.21]MDT9303132.1 hypothetical protein [Limnospira sp. PMC 1281.21]QJB28652